MHYNANESNLRTQRETWLRWLESRKFTKYRTLYHVQDQIADSKRALKSLRTMGQEEEHRINQLQRERIRLKRLVKLFEDSDEEYLKIKKTVKDEVSRILLEGKGLLRLAFYSLMESMRKDPEKYSALIHYASNNASYGNQCYTSLGNRKYLHQLNSYDSFLETLVLTILAEANKLYEQLVK